MVDDDHIHPEPETPSRAKFLFGLSWVLIAIFVFITGTFALAQVWPYNNAFIEQSSGIMSDISTSDGIPVIYEGDKIQYTVNLCNYGVDIYADRWLDSYGPVLPETQNIEVGRDRRINSELIRESTFYSRDNLGCIDGVSVSLELDQSAQSGIYYKLRTNNTYSPNFMTTVTNTTETDLFYLAEEGQEIP